MITSVAQRSLFDFLPGIDLGKLRRFFKVDAPIRSIPPKWRHRTISWVFRSENDHEGAVGYVCSSQDGQRLLFLSAEKLRNNAEVHVQYIKIPPMDYIGSATRFGRSQRKGIGFSGPISEIEEKLDNDTAVLTQDRAWVEQCLRQEGSLPASENNATFG